MSKTYFLFAEWEKLCIFALVKVRAIMPQSFVDIQAHRSGEPLN